jgi:hypothetical protein
MEAKRRPEKTLLQISNIFWILAWASLLLIIMSLLSTPLLQDFDKQLHLLGI